MYNYINASSILYYTSVLKLSQNSESNTEREVSDATDKLQMSTTIRTVKDSYDKLHIEEIIQNAAKVKNVTDKLCDQLTDIQDVLEDLIEKYSLGEDLEEFDFRGFGLRWCGSRLAEYIHIVYVDSMLLLPSDASQVGKGFYYHNDFQAWYDYMYRELVLDFAHSVKEFLENFNEKLVQLAKEAQIEIPRVSVS